MNLNQVKVYFYVRPSKVPGKRGCLYARVTVGGKMLVCSVKSLEMYPEEFDVKTQNPRGNCPIYFEVTEFMLGMRKEVNRVHNDYESRRRVFTIEDLKEAISNVSYRIQNPNQPQHYKTFVDVYKDFLEDQQGKVGGSISKGTYDLRCRYLALVEKCLSELKLSMIPIANYETNEVERIQNWLLAQKYNRNYIGRVMQVANMVFKFGKKKKHINANPYEELEKIRIDKTPNPVWLEPYELERISRLNLSNDPESEQIRDAFVFCCWTGLAIGDYELLNPEVQRETLEKAQSPRHIEPGEIIEIRAGRMLMGRRRKTGTLYRVPMLPGAEAIIKKYGGLHRLPFNLPETGKTLNFLARQAGIKKTLRFHCARKTKANYLINVARIEPYYAIEIMGWKKIEEAAPYTRVSNETLMSRTPQEHSYNTSEPVAAQQQEPSFIGVFKVHRSGGLV